MTVENVTMYRVVCDAPDCTASPQDGGDYYAWADVDGAMEEAVGSDWYVGEGGRVLCPKDSPRHCAECDELVPLEALDAHECEAGTR